MSSIFLFYFPSKLEIIENFASKYRWWSHISWKTSQKTLKCISVVEKYFKRHGLGFIINLCQHEMLRSLAIKIPGSLRQLAWPPAPRRKFDKYFEPNNCHDVPDLIWHKYQYFKSQHLGKFRTFLLWLMGNCKLFCENWWVFICERWSF